MAVVRRHGRGEDIVSRFSTENEEGTTLTCNLCGVTRVGQKWKDRRTSMTKHLKSSHADVYTSDYVLTTEDLKIKEDLNLLGIESGENMHFRKYVAFKFNAIANRADFAFTILSRNIWNNKEVPIKFRTPGIDHFLKPQNRMKREDYEQTVLPDCYEKGHYLAREFFRWSEEAFRRVDIFSIIAIQHRNLNSGHWRSLEEIAAGVTMYRKVRLLTGTQGLLTIPNTSRAQIPRFWYFVILTSDQNDNDWCYSAHVFPNKACQEPLSAYEVSIYDIIALSGINLFTNIHRKMKTLMIREPLPEPFLDWVESKWFPESNDATQLGQQ